MRAIMDSHDAAYIAGLLDGDGSVAFIQRPDASSRRLLVRICQKDRMILDWVHDTVGLGGVYLVGKKAGIHNFIVSSEAARQFLSMILPYLKIKKAQALAALRQDSEQIKRRGVSVLENMQSFEL